MVKVFSNAHEVNIFSSSNVNFYTILSHVLDSDSEILKQNFLCFPKSHQYSPFKGLFFKIFFQGGMPPDPPSVARLPTQSTAATKNSRETTVSSSLIQSASSTKQQQNTTECIKGKHWCVCMFVCGRPSKNCAQGPLPS